MEVIAPLLPLTEKLQLKDEKNLLVQGLPSTIEKQFAKLSFSKNVTPLLKIKKIDFALVFAISHNQLRDILKDVVPALANNAKFWIAYPKVSSKIVSDLSRDCNWQCTAMHGLVTTDSITIDNVWCAMRFTKEAGVQTSSTVNKATISATVRNTTVTTPPELQTLFSHNKKANAFFETLSVTHKQEYIVWINNARKVETRQARLEATIEKLATGKKSPAEK
ncbi:MAG TPA: YdeI/OmpD-associated family protein [Ferruginibacter sp.]|nr:YdeI/OmpD-associated family protein [Ferruginibacter sp.]HMP21754.1 YdeI/OmpD-associated family protein [Ferruginibacter sp.]